MDLAQAAPENGEILAKHIDKPAVNRTPSGDDAIARNAPLPHTEIGLTVRHKGIDFSKWALVKQQIDTLAGGHLARRFVLLNAILASPLQRQIPQVTQFVNLWIRHTISSLCQRAT